MKRVVDIQQNALPVFVILCPDFLTSSGLIIHLSCCRFNVDGQISRHRRILICCISCSLEPLVELFLKKKQNYQQNKLKYYTIIFHLEKVSSIIYFEVNEKFSNIFSSFHTSLKNGKK